MLVSTLILFVAIVILLWAYFRKSKNRLMKLAEKIPGPKPLPFIGNILDIGPSPKALFRSLVRMTEKYGEIFRFWVASELHIAVKNPDYVQIILSDAKNTDKSSAYDFIKPWLGTGLLTSTGEKWKANRKLITPAFHFKTLEAFVEVFNNNTDILVEKLADLVGGSEFDIYPYISLCSLDSICETSMGVRIEAQRNSNSEYVQAVTSMCDVLIARMFNPLLHPDIVFRLSSTGRQHDRNLVILHGMTNTMIKMQRHRMLEASTLAAEVIDDTGRKKRVPFLELLIESQDGAKMSDDEIRQEVDTVMFGGHDTTASALGFICWALATNQHVQERVMVELKEIFGDSGRSPTLHDLRNMKYLEQVIKETLRLFPAVPAFARRINEDINIGDYILPAGADILILPYTIHRNPEYFPDPEKFDPDRFSPENVLGRHPYCYIPFAAGSRNCIGQKYAMLMLKSSASTLLRSYKLLTGITPLDLASELVLKSVTGINIKLESR